ncbi:unnamed protein product [Bursaphelenchus xylophilus]|uniref:(pine wood nematode) hypothetical protein n=1 Tax=Bursaphelenchus xylophilus TaxID=6326 RepID=A0A1I7S0V2_BURXY|nr:unnamed protein product [Bursaphelenchus xylophilus]CAG9088109.1 unnamed protein product [Bursaphelenchus xylophilus]
MSTEMSDDEPNEPYSGKRCKIVHQILQMPLVKSKASSGFKNYCKRINEGQIKLPVEAKCKSNSDKELRKLEVLSVLRSKWNSMPFTSRVKFESEESPEITDFPLVFDCKPVDSSYIPCILCTHNDLRFTNSDTLMVHLNEKHVPEALYVCYCCYRGFFDHGSYREHTKVHDGFKLQNKNSVLLIICSGCGAEFAAKPDEDRRFGEEYVKFMLHHSRANLRLIKIHYNDKITPSVSTFWPSNEIGRIKTKVKSFKVDGQAEILIEDNLKRMSLLRALDVPNKNPKKAFQKGLKVLNGEDSKLNGTYDEKQIFSMDNIDLLKEYSVKLKSHNVERNGQLHDTVSFEISSNNGYFSHGLELDGLNLTQDLYQCRRCCYLDFEEKSFAQHQEECMPKVKRHSSFFKIHSKYQNSNSPIPCFKCKTKHCSVQGLATHFAVKHQVQITVKPHSYSVDATYKIQMDRVKRTVFDQELDVMISEILMSKENDTPVRTPAPVTSSSPTNRLFRTPFIFRKRRLNRLPQVPMIVISPETTSEAGTKTRRRTQKSNLSPNPPDSSRTPSTGGSEKKKLLKKVAEPTPKKKKDTEEQDELEIQMDQIIEKIMAEHKEKTEDANNKLMEMVEIEKRKILEAEKRKECEIEILEMPKTPTPTQEDEDLEASEIIECTAVGPPPDAYDCLMCGSEQKGHISFISHMVSHPEVFNCCPICSSNNIPTSMDNVLQFFDHLISNHLIQSPNGIKCPTCEQICGKDVRDRRSIRVAISHVLYECTRPKQCMLCACTTVGAKRMVETHKMHRTKEHKKVYNRFYCSRCMLGMHNIDQYKVHKCSSVAFRCACDPWVEFKDQPAASYHMAKATDSRKHNLLPTMAQSDLRVIVHNKPPADSKRPSRNEVWDFLKKYDFLRKPNKQNAQDQKNSEQISPTITVKEQTEDSEEIILEKEQKPEENPQKVVDKIPEKKKDTTEKIKEIKKKVREPSPPIETTSDENKSQEKRESASQERKAPKRRRTQPKTVESDEPDLRKRRYTHQQLEQVMLFNQRSRNMCKLHVKEKAQELGVEDEGVIDVMEDIVASVCDKFTAGASSLPWHGKRLGQLKTQAKRKLTPLDMNSLFKEPLPVATPPSGKKYKCIYNDRPDCNEIRDNFAEMREHFQREHGLYARHPTPLDTDVWLCPMCMSIFTHEADLEVHLKSHNHNFRWCIYCTLMCKSEDEYELHSLAHKSKKVALICTEHMNAFDNPFNYFVHLETHGQRVLKFCKMCGFANSSVREVMRHIDKCTQTRFQLGEQLTRARMALGYCIASSAFIRRPLRTEFLQKVMSEKVKFAKMMKCDHSFALFAQGGPVLTCIHCSCPISDLEWCKRYTAEALELSKSRIKTVLNVNQQTGNPDELGNDIRVIPRDPGEIKTGFLIQQCPLSLDNTVLPSTSGTQRNVRCTTDSEAIWQRRCKEEPQESVITLEDDDELMVIAETPKRAPKRSSSVKLVAPQKAGTSKRDVIMNSMNKMSVKPVYRQPERQNVKLIPVQFQPGRMYPLPHNHPQFHVRTVPRSQVVVNPASYAPYAANPRAHPIQLQPNSPVIYRTNQQQNWTVTHRPGNIPASTPSTSRQSQSPWRQM